LSKTIQSALPTEKKKRIEIDWELNDKFLASAIIIIRSRQKNKNKKEFVIHL
jgi:hypothetical protein